MVEKKEPTKRPVTAVLQKAVQEAVKDMYLSKGNPKYHGKGDLKFAKERFEVDPELSSKINSSEKKAHDGPKAVYGILVLNKDYSKTSYKNLENVVEDEKKMKETFKNLAIPDRNIFILKDGSWDKVDLFFLKLR